MTHREQIKEALDHYNGARYWLDDHPVTKASPEERHAAHRIAAHWARRIEALSGV